MEPTCFYWQHHELGPVLGVGLTAELKLDHQFDQTLVKDFMAAHKGHYIFGYLSYDLKNSFEALTSENPDKLNFPALHFWVTESLYRLEEKPRLIWGV